jgi:hypothetical protein
MELQPGNVDAFIRHCIWSAENNRHTRNDNFSEDSDGHRENNKLMSSKQVGLGGIWA